MAEEVTVADKYKIVDTLKTLLKETISLTGKDVYYQATKVLRNIYDIPCVSEKYNERLSNYLNAKNENSALYDELLRRRFNAMREVLLTTVKDIELRSRFEFWDYDKLWYFRYIDFEWNLFLNYLYGVNSEYQNFIYGGVMSHYNSVLVQYQYDIAPETAITVSDEPVEQNPTERDLQLLDLYDKRIKPEYDFYYLELKEKSEIDNECDNNYIPLKTAIIKVLNELIKYVQTLKNPAEIGKEINTIKEKKDILPVSLQKEKNLQILYLLMIGKGGKDLANILSDYTQEKQSYNSIKNNNYRDIYSALTAANMTEAVNTFTTKYGNMEKYLSSDFISFCKKYY